MVFPQCVFFGVVPDYFDLQSLYHNGHMYMVYPQCVLFGVLPDYFDL